MSKGSSQRPYSVSAEDFSNRWNAIFGKEKSDDVSVKEKASGPYGSTETTVSQEGRHDSSGDSPLPADNKPSQ